MQMRERATSTTSSKDLSFSGIWSQDRIFHMAGSFKKSSRDQKSPFDKYLDFRSRYQSWKWQADVKIKSIWTLVNWSEDKKYLKVFLEFGSLDQR